MKLLSKWRKAFLGVSLCAALFITLAYTPDYFEISKNLDIFNAVYRELNVAYVDGTRPGQLMKTGIDAMLNSLDPYTVYFTENEIEEYRYMTTGEYGGIGASVNDIGDRIVITDPYEGFSAFKAGLRAGDEIIAINGVSLKGKRTEDLGPLLKGQANTSVRLRVIKAGKSTPEEVTLTREEIKTRAVPYYNLLPGSETGYIKLVAFTDNCSGEVKEAFNDLKARGCKSLVLDLRGNLGGLLIEAVNIVNFFVEKGQEVVATKGRISEWDKSYLSVHNPIDLQIPITVLVDENSASASEIVSGALQDLDRAVVIGKRTFGKGLVQQTKDLVYNAKIKVTVAKYYIPSGRCVQALDYSHKDEEGRVEKVPDTLITAFKTKGGRIVYDGAGIMPDIVMQEEKPSNILIALQSKHHIFNYATEYALKHSAIASATEFRLDDAAYNAFVAYLEGKDYSYKSKTEEQMEQLLKDAKDDNFYEAIQNEYARLEERMKNQKKDDLQKYKQEIRRQLEEEIVSRYYFQQGRIAYTIRHDELLAEARKVLSEPARHKAILTRIEKPVKPFNPGKKF